MVAFNRATSKFNCCFFLHGTTFAQSVTALPSANHGGNLQIKQVELKEQKENGGSAQNSESKSTACRCVVAQLLIRSEHKSPSVQSGGECCCSLGVSMRWIENDDPQTRRPAMATNTSEVAGQRLTAIWNLNRVRSAATLIRVCF